MRIRDTLLTMQNAKYTLPVHVFSPLQGTSFEYACTIAALLAGAVIGCLTLRRVTNWMRPKVILQLGLIFLGLAVGLIGALAICGGLIYFVPIPDEKLLNFHENLVENK
ncbi:hypothetical protein [Alicyclobacillus dauci]|uniref:Uncharacterized protein n=1 Tax=Alicyclobacillus dauci TaxID=1475485 RepID=A0ABY6Z1U4_9BACL|nr:hypothetical protein [Alicyclobacillus dauci]WAH36715.1 hypothetical protein NZD86_21490 [Alicyclobacillus dauci]